MFAYYTRNTRIPFRKHSSLSSDNAIENDRAPLTESHRHQTSHHSAQFTKGSVPPHERETCVVLYRRKKLPEKNNSVITPLPVLC